jgi:hypothetical protein
MFTGFFITLPSDRKSQKRLKMTSHAAVKPIWGSKNTFSQAAQPAFWSKNMAAPPRDTAPRRRIIEKISILTYIKGGNMVKIMSFHANHIHNDAHVPFRTEFRDLVVAQTALALKIKPKFDGFLALYTREDGAGV